MFIIVKLLGTLKVMHVRRTLKVKTCLHLKLCYLAISEKYLTFNENKTRTFIFCIHQE